MTRLATLLSAMILSGTAASAAERPPQLNVEPSCSVAAAGISGRTRETCMKDEATARQTLTGKWAEFSAEQQKDCTNLVHMGGPPSYVELLTCLEMAQQAKQIPDRHLMNAPDSMKLVD